jgi:hypothetical protein
MFSPVSLALSAETIAQHENISALTAGLPAQDGLSRSCRYSVGCHARSSSLLRWRLDLAVNRSFLWVLQNYEDEEMSDEKEYTGSSVSYYAVDVNAPINEESDPYTAECQDIIEALKLDFNEGNVLKAIWRRAAARLGRSKKGYDDGLYDAEKIVFYGQRLVAIEQRAKRQVEPLHEFPLPSTAEHIGLDLKGLCYVCRHPKHPGVNCPTKNAERDPYGPRDAEGWYAWNGDETMRPAGMVEVELLDGRKLKGSAEKLCWNDISIITKWRPAQ